MLGLYIHIPFCAVKCAYCDFYSLNYNSNLVSNYVEILCERIKNIDKTFDTVYFGGGTPSIIGAENINKILGCIKYNLDAEITVEVNPNSYKRDFFKKIYNSGVNRISIGAQSANENELRLLTRRHSFADVEKTVVDAKAAGFDNISLDIMIGIEEQSINSLENTLTKCIALNPTHISCYMLKVEEGTEFSKMKLNLPDEDDVSNMYLFLCEYLEKQGYKQYEISNFSKKNRESKHNLLYWECNEYIGLGPAAHSFIKGKRYYFPNDINYFLEGNDMIYDCDGGDLYDKIMLSLRLSKGLLLSGIEDKKILSKISKYCHLGYGKIENNRFILNKKGFLIQNSILCDLLEDY